MKQNFKITITIIAVMLIIFAGGCQMLKQGVVTEKTDPREAVVGALNKIKEVKFFREREEFGDDGKVYVESAYVAPDKYKSTFHIGPLVTDAIQIGDDSYVGEAGGPYEKKPVDKSKRGENWQLSSLKNFYSNIEKIKNVRFDRKAELNGKQGLWYQDTDTKNWIVVSPETGLPLKVVEFLSDKGSLTTYFYYDDEPKIEVPANIK